ncbi:hypothetical protein JCM10207_007508 [Rhodosporidiobolus poonsookiae]
MPPPHPLPPRPPAPASADPVHTATPARIQSAESASSHSILPSSCARSFPPVQHRVDRVPSSSLSTYTASAPLSQLNGFEAGSSWTKAPPGFGKENVAPAPQIGPKRTPHPQPRPQQVQTHAPATSFSSAALQHLPPGFGAALGGLSRNATRPPKAATPTASTASAATGRRTTAPSGSLSSRTAVASGGKEKPAGGAATGKKGLPTSGVGVSMPQPRVETASKPVNGSRPGAQPASKQMRGQTTPPSKNGRAKGGKSASLPKGALRLGGVDAGSRKGKAAYDVDQIPEGQPFPAVGHNADVSSDPTFFFHRASGATPLKGLALLASREKEVANELVRRLWPNKASNGQIWGFKTNCHANSSDPLGWRAGPQFLPKTYHGNMFIQHILDGHPNRLVLFGTSALCLNRQSLISLFDALRPGAEIVFLVEAATVAIRVRAVEIVKALRDGDHSNADCRYILADMRIQGLFRAGVQAAVETLGDSRYRAPRPDRLLKQGRVCEVAGCSSLIRGDGRCFKHRIRPARQKACKISGCSTRARRGGFCVYHMPADLKQCQYDGCKKNAAPNRFCPQHTPARKQTARQINEDASSSGSNSSGSNSSGSSSSGEASLGREKYPSTDALDKNDGRDKNGGVYDVMDQFSNEGESPRDEAILPELGALLQQPVSPAHRAMPAPFGLPNAGNQCFANSVLQVLLSVGPLSDLLFRLSTMHLPVLSRYAPVLAALTQLSIHSTSSAVSTSPAMSPSSTTAQGFHVTLSNQPRFRDMVDGRQQDAEEFLGLMLETLDQELFELMQFVGGKVAQLQSPIETIFSGKLSSTVSVPGERASTTLEPFTRLALEIESTNIRSLADAFKHLSASEALPSFETLSGHSTSNATKRVTVREVPPVFVLHLKRFMFNSLSGETSKLSKHIKFAVDLSLEALAPGATAEEDERRKAMKYGLFGVIYHHGHSVSGGHYTVHVRRDLESHEWYEINDAVVEAVSENDVLAEPAQPKTAYLLLYARVG